MSDRDADVEQGESDVSPKESTLLLSGNVVPHCGVVGGVEAEGDAAVQPAFVDGGRRVPCSPRKATASVASMAGAGWFPQALRHESTPVDASCDLLGAVHPSCREAIGSPAQEDEQHCEHGDHDRHADLHHRTSTSSVHSPRHVLIYGYPRGRSCSSNRPTGLRSDSSPVYATSRAPAWAGLGTALVTLYRQRVVRSSLLSAICVTLYLGGIAILHVTTSTILSLQSFNGTANVSVATALAMPGLADGYGGVDTGLENQYHAVD
ncbi:hypothetical protein J3R82DRAFT_6199 [Butyriboletus roseoflavus]|nr:hypothetical protein J3R82DRAFT_6199 [Butyriboletus roseoflavus]